ncbi:MAG: phenylalanine--tRNA ligase subunit beta [Patescibacteria group bacterium]
MKLVRSWLNEFIDLGDRSNESIAAELESLGHEVEAIIQDDFTGVVVGKILTISPHPQADRVQVTTVDTGDRIRTIVCGAPNIEVGQLVPVALPGAKLPKGLEIVERAVRGVVSDGMICAADELGLSDDHSGILILPDSSTIGQPFQAADKEAVFDVALTPNRGDAVSVLGLARDLAARWQVKFITPTNQPIVNLKETPLVQIEDPAGCSIYTARYLEGKFSTHLPSLIEGRLTAVGHGQYHPVVDITNYVMEELGVPLHAFDGDKVQGTVTVRRAGDQESIELLDGQTYQLTKDDLVIADKTGPIALAGIMGGKASSVTEASTRVLLEAANFDPVSIRRTRRRLGLTSTAAYRFERGTDPAMAEVVSHRAAELIQTICQAKVGSLTVSGAVPKQTTLTLPKDSINRRLGTKISHQEAQDILGRLGFTFEDRVVTVPTWRHDVSIPEDLAEEVGRIIGLDNLPREILSQVTLPEIPDHQTWQKIEALKDQLVASGWTEHIGSSFLSSNELKMLEIDDNSESVIRLANPVSEEAAFLRCTLLVSLAKAIAKNPVFPELKLFEVGTVWSQIPTNASGKPSATKNGGEIIAITLAWTGTKPHSLSFLDKPGVTLTEGVAKGFKIRRPVTILESPVEVVLNNLSQLEQPLKTHIKPLAVRIPSRFQPVLRDIAILVDQNISPKKVSAVLNGIPNLVDIELFDQFSGGKLPSGTHSLAFHLLFEHPDHTLNEEKITEAIKKVTTRLVEKLKATIR